MRKLALVITLAFVGATAQTAEARRIHHDHHGRPPHYRQWLCIHRYEGSWTDPGAPYYGGLQMDWNFMSRYGPRLLRLKGTADKWSPWEQMWVSENAWRERGFTPWPSTAAMCGLI